MPGPCSKPNGTKRDTAQYVPPGLAGRLADYEKTVAENQNSKLSFKRPGSQSK